LPYDKIIHIFKKKSRGKRWNIGLGLDAGIEYETKTWRQGGQETFKKKRTRDK
jgi:hypothetical protein